MGLGSRVGARHQTAALVATAVRPEESYDYRPGQRVMTVDGYPGVVTAVQDGPVPGNEAYEVTLDGGMGGGLYSTGQLRPVTGTTAAGHMASEDYPELREILESRPDIAPDRVASKQAHADTFDHGYASNFKKHKRCPHCGFGWVWGNTLGLHDSCPNCAQTSDPDEAGNGDGDADDAASASATATLKTAECDLCDSKSHDTFGHYTATESGDPEGREEERIAEENAALSGMPQDDYCSHCRGAGCLRCYAIKMAHSGHTSPEVGPYHDDGDSDYRRLHGHGEDGGTYMPGLGCPHCEAGFFTEDARSDHLYEHHPDQPDTGQDEIDHIKRIMRDRGHEGQRTAAEQDPSGGPTTDEALDQDPLDDYTAALTADDSDGAWAPGNEYDYASHVRCPNCDSERALVSADGTTSCQDCGYNTVGHKQSAVEPDYRFLTIAASDPDFRWHVTASWKDVREKAKRLRTEGRVRIVSAHGGVVSGEVKGDHHVYETSLLKAPASSHVASWECGCKWASYSWGRSAPYRRFEGRMCSHALAMHYEAQSRGMFGRTVDVDEKAPAWLRPRTRVVTEYNKDDQRNVSRPAQPRKRDVGRAFSVLHEGLGEGTTGSVVQSLVRHAMAAGEDVHETDLALSVVGIKMPKVAAPTNSPGNHPFASPVSADSGRYKMCSYCHGQGCDHCGWDGLVNEHSAATNDPFNEFGHDEDMPQPHVDNGNPASTGFATGPDPWFSHDERGDRGIGIDAMSAKTAMQRCQHCGEEIEPAAWTGGSPEWMDQDGYVMGEDHVHEPEGQHFENPHYDPSAVSTHPGFELPGTAPYPFSFTHTRERPGREDATHYAPFEPDLDRLHSTNTLHAEAHVVDPYVGTSTCIDCGLPERYVDEHLDLGLHGATAEHINNHSEQPAPMSHFPYEPDLSRLHSINTLNADPEPALPQTDGDIDDDEGTPSTPSHPIAAARTEDDIVAAFQRQAAHLDPGQSAGPASSDIAQAARAHLSKTALKDFTPAEQQELINEGATDALGAGNLASLDLSGTHYEQIEAALALDDQDDEGWLV